MYLRTKYSSVQQVKGAVAGIRLPKSQLYYINFFKKKDGIRNRGSLILERKKGQLKKKSWKIPLQQFFKRFDLFLRLFNTFSFQFPFIYNLSTFTRSKWHNRKKLLEERPSPIGLCISLEILTATLEKLLITHQYCKLAY